MTETIGAGGSGAYPTKEHAMQAAADRIGKKEAHAMTDFVTVRRDALRALVEVSVAYHGIPLVVPITEVYTRAVDDRLAAMIVSPWREIDDEARNGQLWLISGFVEDNPEKGRWVVIGRWWPEHGCWTSEEDEPEGWEPEFYPPTLYAPIPELPK